MCASSFCRKLLENTGISSSRSQWLLIHLSLARYEIGLVRYLRKFVTSQSLSKTVSTNIAVGSQVLEGRCQETAIFPLIQYLAFAEVFADGNQSCVWLLSLFNHLPRSRPPWAYSLFWPAKLHGHHALPFQARFLFQCCTMGTIVTQSIGRFYSFERKHEDECVPILVHQSLAG